MVCGVVKRSSGDKLWALLRLSGERDVCVEVLHDGRRRFRQACRLTYLKVSLLRFSFRPCL